MNEVNNDFKIIYKILSSLEKGLDYEEFNSNCIYEIVQDEISIEKYNKLLMMLYDKGLIKGRVWKALDSRGIRNIEITFEGLEYLKENSIMKKIKNELQGWIGIVK